MRKFSLDEFPQLWSVLKGEMSLVGPRPVLTYEWEQFEEWQKGKLAVKPGMISLWHISGKPHDFNEWVRLDLEYIDRWSMGLDLKILLLGIPYLALGKGESVSREDVVKQGSGGAAVQRSRGAGERGRKGVGVQGVSRTD